MADWITLVVNDAFELQRISTLADGLSQPLQASQMQRAAETQSTSSSPRSTLRLEPAIRLSRAILITLQLSTVNFLSSFVNGVIIVSLPRIATDLKLPQELYLWPTSVYGLTTGSTLLICGAVADIVGAKYVEIVGILLIAVFTLGCGFARTGMELVLFRALQGVGSAMHLPSSVSILAQYLDPGKKRNLGFAFLGFLMLMGFAFGLVLGGVLTDSIGWRWGFYLPAAVLFVQSVTTTKLVPTNPRAENVYHRLKHEIDWVGALIGCASLSMFSYVLAVVSVDGDNIRQPSNIVILTISVLLMVLFPCWMWHQTCLGRPALIPNSLWRNVPFTSICILTVFLWGEQNGMEVFSSLYFQQVQLYSAFQASLRVVPAVIVGAIMNLTTGYLVDRLPVFGLVIAALVLSTAGPLVMALVPARWSYWQGAFYSQLLSPLAIDILFTIGLLVVSNSFPESTQALAGAVFNTVAYFGFSMGVNLLQVVSLLVAQMTRSGDQSSPPALLQGYRASFWTMTALMGLCVVVAAGGLRNMGKVGTRRE